MQGYEAAFKYKLIYIIAIHDDAHKGYLKIGEATLSSSLGPTQLPPNCEDLNEAAHNRIKEYTKTALIDYELLYTELAVRFTRMNDGTQMPIPFSDKDIHDVLARSGYDCRRFPDTDRNTEWYPVGLSTAINAIKAYKEFRNVLSASEKTSATATVERDVEQKIVLRQEQEDAVVQTLHVFRTQDTMLWDCKMRYGKTLTTYELIRRAGFQKTIVVTHRPVVGDGWMKEHALIFGKDSTHLFVTKKINGNNYVYDTSIDSENERILKNYAKAGTSFTYFTSIQDLRGSIRAGGKFDKNNAVFDMDWDFIVYDEAHEGTQTERGQTVQTLLETVKKGKKSKVLSLSGTPYNIMGQYKENVYTWDYVMEQRRKKQWAEEHPDEHNPYSDLPEMRIYTFDLHESLTTSYRYETEDMAFNFREFFRTWTGDPQHDYSPIPVGASVGDFCHADDVRRFLDLITQESDDSNYPFSTTEYRSMFRHTFWMVPGVKEARALSKMLKEHPIFSSFAIANIAGEGDMEEAYDDALMKVRAAIKEHPYSITISCGKLTTGVTVPEWSAVMMLAGSAYTAAAGYMQTIFRVQSVGSVDGKQKELAYVFDFAPDRALRVLSEVQCLTKKGKTGDDDGKHALGEFLNFCPVIAVSGTGMVEYDVPKLMRQIKKISVDKAIKSGFDDESIYNEDVGIVMTPDDVKLFNKLASIIHGQPKSKLPSKLKINEQGLSAEEYQKAERVKNKPKRNRTPEEKEALKKQQEQKKEQEKVIRLLRAVSIRLPMLIYGAKVELDEDIRITDFVELVDNESWVEFMPQNVTKDLFKQLLKYYDEDVVIGAGFRIRRLARAADELPPTRRVQRIAEIFALFRNPDKETVLTPWRVVNMHMGDIIGGYNFYAEGYGNDDILEEPRLIDTGEVTADIFLNPDARILEMNSKSGLYPLYLTYSFYAMKLPASENTLPLKETQRLWRETLEENIFVLCKTTMAQCITRRTLAGYQDWIVNAIYLTKLLRRMEDKKRLSRKLTNPATWKKEGERLKFDAIVGNPPYQVSDGGASNSALPIYHEFFIQAKNISPKYISMIMPSRWFSGGRGLDAFRSEMLNDSQIRILHDYPDASECFPGVEIKGGICYLLWKNNDHGLCKIHSHYLGKTNISERSLLEDGLDTFVRHETQVSILKKIQSFKEPNFASILNAGRYFGFHTKVQWKNDGTGTIQSAGGQSSIPINRGETKHYNIKVYIHGGECWIAESDIPKNVSSVYDYKVLIPRSGNPGGSIVGKPKISEPGSCSSNTYVVAILPNHSSSSSCAQHVIEYIKTKFFRLLVATKTATQDMPPKAYEFVPLQDFSKSWNDAELYAKYGLSEDEISFVESMIKSKD